MQVFSWLDPLNPLRIVDVFVQLPLPFEELWKQSEVVPLPSTQVRIASLPHLIRMKRLAGRPQDLADIEHLEHLQKLKQKGS